MSMLKVLRTALSVEGDPTSPRRRVLNVGGSTKLIPIPQHYENWEHLLLDIDPRVQPDVLCDARELSSLEAGTFDAVYCSHNLEHYYAHDTKKVLAGFVHILKEDGFAEIRVPDIKCIAKHMAFSGLDIGDKLYDSAAGPITVHDVLYGLGWEIERSGVDFYAHKAGFTAKSLEAALKAAGFDVVFVRERSEIFEVGAVAFKKAPSPWQQQNLKF